MVNLAQWAVGFIIVFVFAVTLLNPGGGAVAAVVALLIIAAVMFFPFVQDYILSVNKGKAARKMPDSTKENEGDTARK